jgi:hypothetical protein
MRKRREGRGGRGEGGREGGREVGIRTIPLILGNKLGMAGWRVGGTGEGDPQSDISSFVHYTCTYNTYIINYYINYI